MVEGSGEALPAPGSVIGDWLVKVTVLTLVFASAVCVASASGKASVAISRKLNKRTNIPRISFPCLRSSGSYTQANSNSTDCVCAGNVPELTWWLSKYDVCGVSKRTKKERGRVATLFANVLYGRASVT